MTTDSTEHQQFDQSLEGQVNTVQQEARMVLPGIQALFGFQLVAVFNQGFKANLNSTEQMIHLVALLLVAISTILVITPAAYHRQANHQLSAHFVKLSSQFLAWAMAPLAIGSCLDIYVVARVITNVPIAISVSVFIFALYAWLWFIFPRLQAKKVKLSDQFEKV